MQDAREEIRSRLNIEDVVGEYVELKRAGRNLKGLSPFTDEKTPSFMVSPEKQIWHDFSSGKGGDVFSFVMLVEGLEFRESLELLARKAGVELAEFNRGDGKLAKRKERAREALDLAGRYYQQVLLKTPEAVGYITKKRGFNRQTIMDFKIGFAPSDGDGLTKILDQRGFSVSELKDAGLANRFGGDLFRSRMMVALTDQAGSIVGFTGRIIQDDPKAPKYLNTPQTILFDKSRHVFGLAQAKEAIRRAEVAVVVEGNLDVISSHQAGVRNVVATAGTAMTESHLKTLSRLAERIKLAFDGDKAGLAATERAISLAEKVGVELEIVSLPNGAKDPDELIQQDPSLWQKAIDEAKPAVDWVINQYQAREDLSTGEGKRRFTTASLNLIKRLEDPVEREHYLGIVKNIAGVSISTLETKMSSAGQFAKPQLKQPKTNRQASQVSGPKLEELVVWIALASPGSRKWLAALNTEMIDNDESRQLIDSLREPAEITADSPRVLQNIKDYVNIEQTKSDTWYANWTDEDLQIEMAQVVKRLKAKHYKTKKQELDKQLHQAEQAGDEVKADLLRQQINVLIKENR